MGAVGMLVPVVANGWVVARMNMLMTRGSVVPSMSYQSVAGSVSRCLQLQGRITSLMNIIIIIQTYLTILMWVYSLHS